MYVNHTFFGFPITFTTNIDVFKSRALNISSDCCTFEHWFAKVDTF